MPLSKGTTNRARQKNIEQLIAEGYAPRRAVAAAYELQRTAETRAMAKKKKKKSKTKAKKSAKRSKAKKSHKKKKVARHRCGFCGHAATHGASGCEHFKDGKFCSCRHR